MAKKTTPKKAAKKVTPFDAADYLTNEKAIAAYLNEALATGDTAFILHALGTVARAKGVSKIARQAGVTRESLYRSFSKTGNPEFGTVMKSLKAMGIELHAEPA